MQQKAEKAQSIGEAILLQALRGTEVSMDKRDHSSKPGLLECALLMDCSVSTELEWRQCWDRRLSPGEHNEISWMRPWATKAIQGIKVGQKRIIMTFWRQQKPKMGA